MPIAQVRRATIDDLKALVALWELEKLLAPELDKRFKDFQVVEAEGGEILGAIGLEINGIEGHMYAEAFVHPEQSDELRDLLWKRFEMLAKNHGLVRVWTQVDTPFWHNSGMHSPSEAEEAKIPVAFKRELKPWFVIQLRDEPPSKPSLDKEFEMFKESEREDTQKMMRQARALKMVAGVVSVIVFLLVLTWAFFFFKLRSQSGL